MDYSASDVKKVVFTSALSPSESGTSALLLAESIRAYGGQFSEAPIWFYVTPDEHALSVKIRERFLALRVELISFEVDREASKFFFMPEVIAAAEAEERADGEVDTQVWLGPNTMVLREPVDFALPEGKNVGYRPVHHTNIGSGIDSPLNAFWSLIYKSCRVPDERIFPMKTHVDGKTIRPYFNAGHLAIRPEKCLIRKWRELFTTLYRRPEFERFYTEDKYRIFMHQAVLSAVILASFTREELLELPPTYNYPTHLYEEDTTGCRPGSIVELVTVRYEGIYKDPGWEDNVPASESLKRWIKDRLV